MDLNAINHEYHKIMIDANDNATTIRNTDGDVSSPPPAYTQHHPPFESGSEGTLDDDDDDEDYEDLHSNVEQTRSSTRSRSRSQTPESAPNRPWATPTSWPANHARMGNRPPRKSRRRIAELAPYQIRSATNQPTNQKEQRIETMLRISTQTSPI